MIIQDYAFEQRYSGSINVNDYSYVEETTAVLCSLERSEYHSGKKMVYMDRQNASTQMR